MKKKDDPNCKIFVYNANTDANNHQNNDSKPFYVVSNKITLIYSK